MPDSVQVDVTVAEIDLAVVRGVVAAEVALALAAEKTRPVFANTVTVQQENITAPLLAEVNRLRTDPCFGGRLGFGSGTFVIDESLGKLDNNRGGFDIGGDATTKIRYAGNEPIMLQLECSTGGSGFKPRSKVHDMVIEDMAPGPGRIALLCEDTQGNKIRDLNVRNFDIGVRFWNAQSWSELNLVENCGFTCITKAVDFRPGDVDGLGGTASFARTDLINLTVSGAGGIWLDGGPYECVIRDVGGNVASGNTALLTIASGNYGGTIIDGLWGLETNDGGGGGSCLWRKLPEMTGTMPTCMAHTRVSGGNFEYDNNAPFLWSPKIQHGSIAFLDAPSSPSNEPGRTKLFAKAGATPGMYEKRPTGGDVKL